ncbi:MAG: hypothetical protein ACLUBL_02675 [Fusobacterium sp.]|uniref:hypothetical protein n=1 Tax=Fusobacterium sp. TaxID=68766 RepID=UPI0039919B89
MESIKMIDGDLVFDERVKDLDEFLQRWINTLKVDSTECFYNERLGLSKSILFDQNNNVYKLEHIKKKSLELFGNELENLYYKIISENNRTLEANFYFTHKKFKEFMKGVEIVDNQFRN